MTTIKRHSLSRRILIQFCLFTFIISIVYGLFTLVLMYTLEDGFIEREIMAEAERLETVYQETGQWQQPEKPFMTLYQKAQDLPDDIYPIFVEEPNRKEFFGQNGKHFHLYQIKTNGIVYLVAEVSDLLLVRPMREDIIRFMVFFGLTLVAIACLIAWLIGRKLANPLKQLAALVHDTPLENIPEKFAHRFPRNEIGLLAETLETAFQANKRALSREKNFTRDVSHEMRTPLAVIKNAVEVFHGALDKDEVNDIIQRVGESSNQMELTINSLLMLARHETSDVCVEQFSPRAIIEQAIIDHAYMLNHKSVDVDAENITELTLTMSKGMFSVVLNNLISNAFQYTQTGSVIIRCDQRALIVADTGPGIDEDLKETVTNVAVRGSESVGYGFGLSIVKRLCEHQGWQLMVESLNGTTITVVFNQP